MGTPPAPPYATIYYGIHEEKFLLHHSQRVIYYRRFIDDVIGIWCPNKNPKLDESEWNDFKQKNELISWPHMGIQRMIENGRLHGYDHLYQQFEHD